MATIKAYTDIPQSKKLAEILPIETADMNWYLLPKDPLGRTTWIARTQPYKGGSVIKGDYPCWSLASLLGVLPKIINNETLFIETSAVLWHIGYRNIYTARADNPVDACYEMIIRLNKLKML